jgi:hypothetical protein
MCAPARRVGRGGIRTPIPGATAGGGTASRSSLRGSKAAGCRSPGETRISLHSPGPGGRRGAGVGPRPPLMRRNRTRFLSGDASGVPPAAREAVLPGASDVFAAVDDKPPGALVHTVGEPERSPPPLQAGNRAQQGSPRAPMAPAAHSGGVALVAAQASRPSSTARPHALPAGGAADPFELGTRSVGTACEPIRARRAAGRRRNWEQVPVDDRVGLHVGSPPPTAVKDPVPARPAVGTLLEHRARLPHWNRRSTGRSARGSP